MNQTQFRRTKASFLHRRYGIRLGRRYASAAASLFVLGLVGCTKINDIESSVAQSLPSQLHPATKQIVTPVVNSEVARANTKFGFKLFSEMLKQDSSKNIFISPTSVGIALAMTYNGASGETKQAMAKTLELQEINLQELNSANAAIIAALENTEVELNIANSLWVKEEYPVKQNFLQKTQKYKAKVTNLDFSDRNASTVINNWVSQSTQGKIKQIINNINSNDVLFLINAIYFKGKWTTQFDKNQTTNSPFYLATESQKQHPMMSQKGEYKYYENEKFQAISLPYGQNEKFSLYIFLPNKDSSLSAFSQDLNAENWEKWMTLFKTKEGLIKLPRFQMESDITLNDTLKALGMSVAFGEQANFSGIGDNLAISEVKHKTFVQVDEAGTEAAAATSVGIELVAAMPVEPFQMIVDRPFFSAIRDNQTGTVLFMGYILDPQ